MTSASPAGLRIAVADDERDVRQFFQELLPLLGHTVVANVATGRELVESCRLTAPDLIITDIKMPDTDGLASVAEVNRDRPVPVVLVSGHQDAELLAGASADYIMAYLVKPVKPPDLVAAIQVAILRFRQFQAIRKEANDLRQALEDRKAIERAKGIIMKRLGVDEEGGFRRLRKLSSDSNAKLAQTAQRIVKADEIFQELEQLQ